MPKFLEEQLRQSAAKKGFTGRRADAYVYGAENNLGAMHGNKETAKGREMEKKHEEDMSKNKVKSEPMREMRIEIHRGPAPKGQPHGPVTGFTVHHHMVPKPHGKSGAFMEDTHVSHPFSADDHEKMLAHVDSHLAGQHTATYDGDRTGDKGKEEEGNEAYDGE